MPPYSSTGAAAIRRAACLAALLALVGCTEPRGAAFEPSPVARAAPRPALGPTAPLRDAALQAGEDAARLAADTAVLAERRDAAQARGAALAGPVLDPALRERLLGAAGRAAALRTPEES